MIIAEIGLSHEGSLGLAHSYIDALADKGIDVIKFQTHIAEAVQNSKNFELSLANRIKPDLITGKELNSLKLSGKV